MKIEGFTINEKLGRIQKIRLNVCVRNLVGDRLNNLPAIIDTGATHTCVSHKPVNLETNRKGYIPNCIGEISG